MENFEKKVLNYLKSNKTGILWTTEAFYELCHEWIGEPQENPKAIIKIRKKLLGMSKRGLIKISREGTGYGGFDYKRAKTMNVYYDLEYSRGFPQRMFSKKIKW